MPWQLILSTLPIVMLLVALLRYELRVGRSMKKKHEEEKALLVPLAKKMQKKHELKYGRPNTELEREFPELNQAK